MVDIPYFEKDTKYYCEDCVKDLTEKCSCGCGKPLIGKLIMPQSGKKFLAGHFRCK